MDCRSANANSGANGGDWLPVRRAARTLSVTIADSRSGTSRDAPIIRLWEQVRKGVLAFKLNTHPPSDERIAGLTPFADEWFDACFGNSEVWGPVGADYGNFFAALWEWLKADGISISRPSLYRHIREMHACSDAALMDAEAATTWNFPQALAWIASRDPIIVETIRWAFAAFGPKTAVYQSEGGLADWHSEWIGWLVIQTAEDHCRCGCKPNENQERWEVCRCVGNAWNELIGLPELAGVEVPRLDARPSTGTFSITWPDQAEKTWLPVTKIKSQWPVDMLDSAKQAKPCAGRKRPGPPPDSDWPDAHLPLRTGDPGRPPKGYQIYVAEHNRRCEAGEALEKVAHEAEHLAAWYALQYPTADRVSPGTVENRIRPRHRQYSGPKPHEIIASG